MRDWTPDKIIALVMVIGCLVLIVLGRNSSVIAILSMAAAYLFGTVIEHYRKEECGPADYDDDQPPGS